MRCPHCNASDHEENARFCHVCGTPLVNDDESSIHGINTPKNDDTHDSTNKGRPSRNYTCQHIADSNLFAQFPAVREELLAINFDGDYYTYEDIFLRTLNIISRLTNMLTDEDIILSNNYSSFSPKVYNYLQRQIIVRRSELRAYEEEGDRLLNEGYAMRNAVVNDKRNGKYLSERKRKRRNIIIAVSIVAIVSILLCWRVTLSSYSDGLSLLEKCIFLICLLTIDGGIFAFLREYYMDDD